MNSIMATNSITTPIMATIQQNLFAYGNNPANRLSSFFYYSYLWFLCRKHTKNNSKCDKNNSL